VPAKAGMNILRVEHELPTAAVGRFVASADRPPPWTTLLWWLAKTGSAVAVRISAHRGRRFRLMVDGISA
jgi:hypothetical protein